MSSLSRLKAAKKLTWTIGFILFASVAQAQNVAGGLQNLVDQIKIIANIIFIGAIIWSAITTIIAFAGESPSAMRKVMYTLIIALFWFGFNYFVDDVAAALGGAGADTFGGG